LSFETVKDIIDGVRLSRAPFMAKQKSEGKKQSKAISVDGKNFIG